MIYEFKNNILLLKNNKKNLSDFLDRNYVSAAFAKFRAHYGLTKEEMVSCIYCFQDASHNLFLIVDRFMQWLLSKNDDEY
jgi:hypothetical protein